MLHPAPWANVVFWPTSHVGQGVAWVLFLGDDPPKKALDPRYAMSIGARVYFLACLLVLFSLCRFLPPLLERVQTRPRASS